MGKKLGPSLRWLHLSDPHIRVPHGTASLGDQQDVIDSVLRFIREKIPDEDRPDYVFVTGDLAFTGTAADYTAGPGMTVSNFLDQLCDAARVPKSQLFVVPGNHDVNRDAIIRACAKEDVALAKNAMESDQPEEICNKIINRLFPKDKRDYDDRDALLKRHAAYVEFCRSYFGDDRYPGLADTSVPPALAVLHYAQRLVVPRNGLKFGLAGLCSSWASQSRWRASDEGDEEDIENSQFLCVKTVRDVIQSLQEADFRLALCHHPPEWLVEPERERLFQENQLFTEFDFVLTGHRHKAERLWNAPQQGLRAFRSSAGAIFNGRPHHNAFNLVEVWPEAGHGRRMVVAWHKHTGRWVPDMGFADGANSAWREFRLPR